MKLLLLAALALFGRDESENGCELTKITADDTGGILDEDFEQDGANFGFACDLQGDVAVVGAPFENHSSLTDPGTIYVFERESGTNNWDMIDRFLAPTARLDGRFGHAVAISRNRKWIAACEPGSNIGGRRYNDVHLYEDHATNGWQFYETVTVNDQMDGERPPSLNFGDKNNYLAVGCPGDGLGGAGQQEEGEVTILRFDDGGDDSWDHQANLSGLLPSPSLDVAINDRFGSFVEMVGDPGEGQQVCLVGIPEGPGPHRQGSVALFDHNSGDTWTFRSHGATGVITVVEPTIRDGLWGVDGALNKDLVRIAVGAEEYEPGTNNQNYGLMYYMKPDGSGGFETDEIVEGEQGMNGELFGSAIAWRIKKTMLIGSRGLNGSGGSPDHGRVEIFKFESGAWVSKTRYDLSDEIDTMASGTGHRRALGARTALGMGVKYFIMGAGAGYNTDIATGTRTGAAWIGNHTTCPTEVE